MIRWGKRKLMMSNDEENSGFGFNVGGFPLTFSVWGKRIAIDFCEEAIFDENDE